MSTQPDEGLEIIYNDYLEEVERIKKERNRAFNQYRLGAFIGPLIMIAAVLGYLPPYAFWGGLIISLILLGVAYVMANNHAEKEVNKTAQSRPGFTEFYKLSSNRKYWPYEIVAGEKYDKFLSIIGRKGSE